MDQASSKLLPPNPHDPTTRKPEQKKINFAQRRKSSKNLGQLDQTWWEREGGGELDKVVHEVIELVRGAGVGKVQEEVLDQAQF